MKPATFAPAYCALYPKLAELAREHGYALAIHGSMARDFDLVCIPWREEVSRPQVVVDAIISRFDIRQIGTYEQKLHGRVAFAISIGFGQCFIDLSFIGRPSSMEEWP